jgi:nitroreductase
MMSFLELVNKRQSDRSYLDKPVEREKIERCLEAARLAPSACNAQPWHFIVVDDPELKNLVAKETLGPLGTLNRFARKAPVLIVVVAEKPNLTSQAGAKIKDNPYYMMDIGIAAEHICLQAVEEGLGTCLMGWFNEDAVKKLLAVPFNKKIGLIISLGYPAGKVNTKKRKSLEQIVGYNRYK